MKLALAFLLIAGITPAYAAPMTQEACLQQSYAAERWPRAATKVISRFDRLLAATTSAEAHGAYKKKFWSSQMKFILAFLLIAGITPAHGQTVHSPAASHHCSLAINPVHLQRAATFNEMKAAADHADTPSCAQAANATRSPAL